MLTGRPVSSEGCRSFTNAVKSSAIKYSFTVLSTQNFHRTQNLKLLQDSKPKSSAVTSESQQQSDSVRSTCRTPALIWQMENDRIAPCGGDDWNKAGTAVQIPFQKESMQLTSRQTSSHFNRISYMTCFYSKTFGGLVGGVFTSPSVFYKSFSLRLIKTEVILINTKWNMLSTGCLQKGNMEMTEELQCVI